jgi:hypothetical protein
VKYCFESRHAVPCKQPCAGCSADCDPKNTREVVKRFREQQNVGMAKYVVNFHNGVSKNRDGSDFWDIKIFKNKVQKNRFIRDLTAKGYLPA